MTRQIVLLRAVNVAGHGTIAMADLRDCLTRLGLQDVRTLLQSGNVVLRCKPAGGAKLEALLEKELARLLGLRTDVFVRSAAEWADLVAANPFPAEAKADPAHLVAVFAKRKPTDAAVEALRAAASRSGPELVRACNGQVYITYPAGIGRSRLTTAAIERALGTSVTGRNWNTVLKIAGAAG